MSCTGIAVEADDALEQLHAQNGRAELLLLGDNLQQHGARQVFARAIVDHLHLLAAGDQAPDVLERDVAAGGGVVQSAVGVFADDSGLRHVSPVADR